ncbi:MAG: putative metal-binding motif-containing protein, partial [Myxococcales bacterium]|nr:putative metal-binding motif-containing protein [Myxococcales bacterium]
MHRLASKLLGVLALGAIAPACAVHLPIAGDPGYACFTDDDCVDGFRCDEATADTPGVCVSERGGDVNDCVDNDGDGAFVGTTCATGQPIDCDDTSNLRSPAGTELCDGIDNDCDCVADTNGDGVVCGIGDDNVDEELAPRRCPLQVGVCAGAMSECTDGAWVDCVDAGLYGEDYELTETSCDTINNDCDGETDEDCECTPGVDVAVECGSDTGACTRGVQLCLGDGSLSGCLAARLGHVCANGTACTSDLDCIDGSDCVPETCDSDADCGTGGVCVGENLEDEEDLFDACTIDEPEGCARAVCRYLSPGSTCTTDADCGGQTCIDGECRAGVVVPLAELCNGEDDDCDGAIDNDVTRLLICGPCPYNMAFLSITTPAGASDFACVDWYEASRPDATATSAGSNELYTLPRPGVVPWTGLGPDVASSICRAEPLREVVRAGQTPIATKRLCKTYEWNQGCGGKDGTVEDFTYPYATSRDTDTFVAGNCVDGSLSRAEPATTGSLDSCCRYHGTATGEDRDRVCDAVGNVAEYVSDSSNTPL